MGRKKGGAQKGFSFEEAMSRLDKIVKELESGDLSLEASLARFEEGVKLSRECRDFLFASRQRVELLLKEEGSGRLSLESYEEDVDEDDEEEDED